MKIGKLRDELENCDDDDEEIYVEDFDGWLYEFTVVESEVRNRWKLSPLPDQRMPDGES